MEALQEAMGTGSVDQAEMVGRLISKVGALFFPFITLLNSFHLVQQQGGRSLVSFPADHCC